MNTQALKTRDLKSIDWLNLKKVNQDKRVEHIGLMKGMETPNSPKFDEPKIQS